MDFWVFFHGLGDEDQRAFARRARYARRSLQIHFACAGYRRRRPSTSGFLRLVKACDHFRANGHPSAPGQAELFEYFYRPKRRRPRGSGRVTFAEATA